MAEHGDIVVIGAGPAGLAAVQAAASGGRRVVLVDSQAAAGGQVWRRDARFGQPAAARRAIAAALAPPGVDYRPATQVLAAEPGRLLLQDAARGYWLDYGALVLAGGARELLLPFPGWTLPGVTGAGGLQALAKQGWPLAGRRVLIAGSGPLLLAAAATARRHGAIVLGIHEQAPAAAVRRFAGSLWRWPGKLAQAAALRLRLAGIPYCAGSVVAAALGEETLRAVELEGPAGRERIDCDLLAVGYGLLPQVELARLLGCELDDGVHPAVRVDARQATSVAGVYAAGELCGIGGRDCARLEGRLAGLAAAGLAAPPRLLRRRGRARAFAGLLPRHFALGERVRRLATPDTLVCRCEDVPLAALAAQPDARSAKLATRCGMGACQGRVCGGALAELGLFPPAGPRPPVFPARLATLGEPDPSVRDPRDIRP
jgi:NADPH-dependent 2,4-dienoyl-CoA reductase/sulfur reductase-like enzyme